MVVKDWLSVQVTVSSRRGWRLISAISPQSLIANDWPLTVTAVSANGAGRRVIEKLEKRVWNGSFCVMAEIDPTDLARLREDIGGSGVRRALDVIGDRSTLLILLGAFCGYGRFEDWQRQHNMSRSVLSERLLRLIREGLLRKEPLRKGGAAGRYVLTPKGEALFPWALAVWRWEHLWIHRDGGHPVHILHLDCKQVGKPEIVCAHCNIELAGNDIDFQRGPGFRVIDGQDQKTRRRSVNANIGADNNFIGRIVDLIGDRWSYLILSSAYLNVRRFDDFLNCLGIAPNILSDRLKRFVDAGLLAKDCYASRPKRYEYILTQKSFDLLTVMITMGQWADQWLSDEAGPPHVRRHLSCGASLKVNVVCGACGEMLTRNNIAFVRIAEISERPHGLVDGKWMLVESRPN